MLVENASLRESLLVIQKEFVSLLNEQNKKNKTLLTKGTEGGGVKDPDDFGGLSSGHFQMPYDIVRDGECRELGLEQCQGCALNTGIEKSFRDNLQRLREQLQKSQIPGMVLGP